MASRERYGFALLVSKDYGTKNEDYDVLGVVEVNIGFGGTPEELGGQLRPWALTTLAAGRHGFGRYLAELATLDADGDPDRLVATETIAWSGEAELQPTSTS